LGVFLCVLTGPFFLCVSFFCWFWCLCFVGWVVACRGRVGGFGVSSVGFYLFSGGGFQWFVGVFLFVGMRRAFFVSVSCQPNLVVFWVYVSVCSGYCVEWVHMG
jgi:hypothetical protein